MKDFDLSSVYAPYSCISSFQFEKFFTKYYATVLPQSPIKHIVCSSKKHCFENIINLSLVGPLSIKFSVFWHKTENSNNMLHSVEYPIIHSNFHHRLAINYCLNSFKNAESAFTRDQQLLLNLKFLTNN